MFASFHTQTYKISIIPTGSEASTEEVVADHDLRSQFVQRLISESSEFAPLTYEGLPPPRLLVQFWDDVDHIPLDVQDCINTWASLDQAGFKRLLFDDMTAKRFIENYFDHRHVLAFERCRHPAMRSDYFRLCFIFKMGGFYVDSDDVYLGENVEMLLSNGRLKLQPLCYDVENDSMLDPGTSAVTHAIGARIFYVNNNPLIASAGNPIIANALARATSLVLAGAMNSRDIQTLTGPGNLTISLVRHALELQQCNSPRDFEIITNWESIARSQWPLEYRSDDRNWRNWVRGDG